MYVCSVHIHDLPCTMYRLNVPEKGLGGIFFFIVENKFSQISYAYICNCCTRVVLSIKDIKMTSVFTMLRKCCNHPYLLEFPLTLNGDFLIDEQLVTSCGKVLLLDRMLPALIKREHKVL